MGITGSQEPGPARMFVSGDVRRPPTMKEWADLLRKIAALGVFLGLLLAGCGSPPAPKVQISPADIARQAPAPIQISPRVAGIYSGYLNRISGDVSGVFAVSPNGNRLEYRFCEHPDCLLIDDEIAARALSRCDRGVPHKDPANRCLVFDRNGKVNQPYRTWSEADFDMPLSAPPLLDVKDPAVLAGRYAAMTPDGQMIISLRPDGRAYLWDTEDGFHQAGWSIKESGVCVDSIDGRSAMTCGKLYGNDPDHLVGATLDLFPGKYLTITRLANTAE
jgi:hypothetical protein